MENSSISYFCSVNHLNVSVSQPSVNDGKKQRNSSRFPFSGHNAHSDVDHVIDRWLYNI